MIFLPKRRPIFPEVLLLLFLALVIALLVNVIRPHGLALFENWEKIRLTDEPSLTLEQAKSALAKGDVLFLDARSFSEYASAHIPGAGSLPLESVRDRNEPLLVVVYCGNDLCAKAESLTKRLEKRGMRFVFMPEGLSGWLSAGGPLEGK